MNIDEFKSDWQNIIIASSSSVSDVEQRVAGNKVASLGRQFFRLNIWMVCLCGIGIAMFLPYWGVDKTLMLLSIGYFLIMGVILLRQAFLVRKIDLCRMGAVNALEAVCRLEKDRIVKRCLGICLSIPLLGYLTYILYLNYGIPVLYGCAAGGLAGAALGFMINRKATLILRSMKAQLEE